MWSGAATRGYFNYHGTPAMAVVCVLDAYFLDQCVLKRRCRIMVKVICGVLLLVYLLPYLLIVRSFSPWEMWYGFFDKKSTSYVIDLLTEDREVVGFSTFDTRYIFESGTSPTKLHAACPWIWEFGGKEALERCEEKPPRVFLYDPGYCTWGYPIVDYAEELFVFITKNYTPLAEYGYDTLYIRNDYYDSAVRLLEDDYLQRTGFDIPKLTMSTKVDWDNNSIIVSLSSESQFERITLAVWTEADGQDDLVWYETELLNNEWLGFIDINRHETQGRYIIHVYAEGEMLESMSRLASKTVELGE